MFSDHFFRSLNFWINWVGCPLGAGPYKLDLKRKRLYITFKSQRRCIRVWIFLACQNLLLIWMILYTKITQNYDAFNHVYLGWVLSSIWCLCLGAGAFRGELIIYITNQYYIFFDRFMRK